MVKHAVKKIVEDPEKAIEYGVGEVDMEPHWRAYAAFCLDQFNDDFNMYKQYPRTGYSCFVMNKGNVQQVPTGWRGDFELPLHFKPSFMLPELI